MLTVERLPDEPIVKVTITGRVTPDVIKEMFVQCAALADQIGTDTVYRVTDLRDIETTFTDLVLILAETTKAGLPGSPVDPRFYGAIVGSDQWVQMYSAAAKQQQYGALTIPAFTTIEEALAYLRAEIARRTADSPHP